ncbi:MAG: UDP-N-acetylglucosamine--N-acetylmuramyl-(pentapeptide) pyrophosphoryl-undecaprenol N-acetylglucosamine transferase [Actinobacteria bacterium]|nr:UDP-N-acetylglucosamine--N-acetylmuramyl-(pentapeptide) pyrophosphoryl-undecaprenol N-acetylglucosamine transferase [Actinomycetota bacterium]
MPGTILFAAGGTMGHIGPAISVAELLWERNPHLRIEFVGTKSGLELTLASKFHWNFITKAPLPRAISPASLNFPFKFFMALLQSIPFVRKSSVVVGFGGYVATPIYLAARILRRPIVIHEANALAGFANKLGRKWARATFVNFDSLGALWKAETIGIPLKQEIAELALKAHHSSDRKGTREMRDDSPRILVLGGSTGSAKINRVIWDSLDALRDRYKIRHSVGGGNLIGAPAQDERYRAQEFIEEMVSAYDQADLVIARAGAVTCAEIRELGKRAILVPLGHGNGEQMLNAQELVESENAVAVTDSEFTAKWLAENVERALALSPKLPVRPLLQAREIMATRIETIINEEVRS